MKILWLLCQLVLLLVVPKNDTAPIGVLLLNLKQTQSWIDHVMIFHDGISSKDQKVMQSIFPVEFIRYHFPGDTAKFNEIVKYVYTEMIFCKYECFSLLKRFDYVFWTDYDVVFQRDVKELLTPSLMGIKTLMYRETDAVRTLGHQLRSGMEKRLDKKYDLNALSMATGLFVLDHHLPVEPERLYEHCITLTERYGDALALPEQAIFDLLFQDFSIVPEPISWEYATHPSNEKSVSAPILHAYSQPKFWNGLECVQWSENYRKWRILGGSCWKVGWAVLLRRLKKTFSYRWRKLWHF